MKLNADFSQRVAIDAGVLPWAPSPSPLVERRMLDREGDELARATSLVRYAASSRFPAHTHGGGEEVLVLDGAFSDRSGDFPRGTYLRNPVGSSHAPHSDEGCVIFVKLWWSWPDDRDVVRIDTTDESRWRPNDVAGIEVMPLHRFRDETTALYRLAPGTALPARAIPGGEEILVLAGACEDAAGAYRQLTWLRRPPGRADALASPGGCRLFVKRGHLAELPPAPPV